MSLFVAFEAPPRSEVSFSVASPAKAAPSAAVEIPRFQSEFNQNATPFKLVIVELFNCSCRMLRIFEFKVSNVASATERCHCANLFKQSFELRLIARRREVRNIKPRRSTVRHFYNNFFLGFVFFYINFKQCFD